MILESEFRVLQSLIVTFSIDRGIVEYIGHFAKYPEYPSLSKRKELLAEVHKIPGGEWYGLPSLYQWFKTRIQRKRDDDDDDEALRPTDRIRE